MIKIRIGNLGSGKTACEVKNIINDTSGIITYTNIRIRGLKNCKLLTKEMILKKELIRTKRDGTPVYKIEVNEEFWKKVPKPINCILDEAHSILNSRRSMSTRNIVITNWLSLLRRMLNSSTGKTGDLTLITQLPDRLDSIAREMSRQTSYHRCHWITRCNKCGYSIREHSDQPELMKRCLRCGSYDLKQTDHIVEIWKFKTIEDYDSWHFDHNRRTYYAHKFIRNISETFNKYDTRQWDNLFSEEDV